MPDSKIEPSKFESNIRGKVSVRLYVAAARDNLRSDLMREHPYYHITRRSRNLGGVQNGFVAYVGG